MQWWVSMEESVLTSRFRSANGRIRRFFEPKRLFGVGRWGTWRYHNSDVCIREAMTFVREKA